MIITVTSVLSNQILIFNRPSILSLPSIPSNILRLCRTDVQQLHIISLLYYSFSYSGIRRPGAQAWRLAATEAAPPGGTLGGYSFEQSWKVLRHLGLLLARLQLIFVAAHCCSTSMFPAMAADDDMILLSYLDLRPISYMISQP